MTTPTDIHSCSYFCTRPACVLAQRDELRDSHGAGNQVPPTAQPATRKDCGEAGCAEDRCGNAGCLPSAQPAAQPVQRRPALASIESAPACLNMNDKAMWVTGWNECRDAIAARPGGAS